MVPASAPLTRPYRGESAEDRRSARRERLLDAGLELLGTHGHDGTTVRAVCREARLTPRYFYESFDDLDDLVAQVFDRIVDQVGVALLDALDDAPDDAYGRSRVAIEALVHWFTDDPRRGRIAFVEALGNERLARRRIDAMRLFSDMLAAHAADFYGARERDRLLRVTAALLVGGMAELLIAWLDGSLEVTREELVDDVTELFVATGEGAVRLAKRRAAR